VKKLLAIFILLVCLACYVYVRQQQQANEEVSRIHFVTPGNTNVNRVRARSILQAFTHNYNIDVNGRVLNQSNLPLPGIQLEFVVMRQFYPAAISKTIRVTSDKDGKFQIHDYGIEMSINQAALQGLEIVPYTLPSLNAQDLLRVSGELTLILRPAKSPSSNSFAISRSDAIPFNVSSYRGFLPMGATNYGLEFVVELSPRTQRDNVGEVEIRVTPFPAGNLRLSPTLSDCIVKSTNESVLVFSVRNSLSVNPFALAFQLSGSVEELYQFDLDCGLNVARGADGRMEITGAYTRQNPR
jgi:hypothetical protein